MSIPKEYIGYLSAQMATKLADSGKVKSRDKPAVSGAIQQVILDDAAKEDRLNQEVRDYLDKYNEQIRRDGLSYQEMYQLVKKELMKKYKMVPSTGRGKEAGKLSRDKVIELSHGLIKALAAIPQQVELTVDKNEVRLQMMQDLQELLRAESGIDKSVREKIQSQKREISEGSAEWDILFRKYYSEEMRKLGVT